MKETINYRFNKFKRYGVGSIIILEEAVRGMKYGQQKVIDAFNKFVSKNEFAKDERDGVLEWLLSRNKSDENPKIPFKNKTEEN